MLNCIIVGAFVIGLVVGCGVKRNLVAVWAGQALAR